jgi:hypothetical protein
LAGPIAWGGAVAWRGLAELLELAAWGLVSDY